MKIRLRDIDKKWKEYALAGCVVVLFFVILTNIGKLWGMIAEFNRVMKPVFLGFVLAYIFNPLAVMFNNRVFKGIKKKKVKWSLSVVLTLIIILLAMTLLVVSLIPQIADNITSFVDNYPAYVDELVSFIQEKDEALGGLSFTENIIEMISSGKGMLSKLGEYLTSNAGDILQTTTNIGSAALNWLIGGIFAIYFLLAKNGIKKACSKALSLMLTPLKFKQVGIVLDKFHNIFSKYIVFELLDSLIVGVTSYIFMIIVKMPDALFLAFIFGITNLIPTFGPIIGAGIGSFILLLLDPRQILPLLIFTLVIQSLDAYVIKPKLFGDALNVPGAIILIAIVVFGKLMGIVGMLLAIPFAAILVYFYSEVFIPWLELKREMENFIQEQVTAKPKDFL